MSLTETKTNAGKAQLSQDRVREILKRHPGSIGQLADELGVTITSVSMVLRGRGTSQRIEQAAQKRAAELLKREAA